MIAANVRRLKERLAAACAACGRAAADVRVVAASKYADAGRMREAYAAGLRLFGENRWQDAEAKMREVSTPDIEWHFIGRVQSNKLRRIFESFDMVQSVDRTDILTRAEAVMAARGRARDVLLQVNLTGESERAGYAYGELDDFFSKGLHRAFAHIRVRGLMGMGPHTDEKGTVRAAFGALKERFDRYRRDAPDLTVLSMGMSHDFEEAVYAGSTMIRVGSFIFERKDRT